MKSAAGYFFVTLAAGMLGVVAGVWISQEDSGKTATPQPTIQQQTTRYVQVSEVNGKQAPENLELRDIYQQENIFEQLRFAYNLAVVSNIGQLTKHLETVIQDFDPLFNHNIASIFLERMVVLDPLSALEFIDTHRTMNQNAFISHVITSWIRQDPEAAIDYFKSMQNKQLKNIIGARLLEDPTLKRGGLLAEIEIELGSSAQLIMERIRLKRMSAANAFDEALLRTDHRRREEMMRAIGRWYQQDPEAAMARVAALTSYSERQQLMQVIMSMQSRQDPELALEMLQQFAPDDKALRQQALMNYANQDPLGALPRIESWVAETGNYDLMGNLISKWIQIDETAALAYLDTIPEQYKGSVIQSLAFTYINHSPEKGMAWLMSLGPEFDLNTKRTALHALSRYPDIAESWLARLESEPEFQGILLSQIARRKAQSDPTSAFEWLEQYSESPEFEAARASVLQAWTRREPEKVADMLEGNANDSGYSHIFSMTGSSWISKDVDATLSWIESLPDSINKQAALSSAISNIKDPERALSLIEDLPESSARNMKMQLAHNLLNRNQDDVESIIRRLDLKGEEAETLRRVDEQRSNSGRIRQF